MLEVHAILQRQRCNENMTEKTGTLSDAYQRQRCNENMTEKTGTLSDAYRELEV